VRSRSDRLIQIQQPRTDGCAARSARACPSPPESPFPRAIRKSRAPEIARCSPGIFRPCIPPSSRRQNNRQKCRFLDGCRPTRRFAVLHQLAPMTGVFVRGFAFRDSTTNSGFDPRRAPPVAARRKDSRLGPLARARTSTKTTVLRPVAAFFGVARERPSIGSTP